MKKIERKMIRRAYYFSSLAVLFITAFTLSLPYFTSLRTEYKRKVSQLSEGIVEQKRIYLEAVILEKVTDIRQTEDNLVNEYSLLAKSVIDSLLLIASNSDLTYPDAVEADINSSLSDSVLEHLDYIVFRRSGEEIIATTLSAEEIERFAGPAELYTSDHVPVYSDSQFGTDITIGVFMTDEALHALVQERAKSDIREVKLPDDGYIWINKILDYGGGDGYAVRLVHPNLIETEGMLLSTKMEDIKGNLPYLEELEGVRDYGEVYLDYYFKKMNSDTISHKLSYAKLYKPYDWVIATGVYLDDVDELVQMEKMNMEATFSRETRKIILILFCAVAVSVTLMILLEKKVGSLIIMYTTALQDSNSRLSEEKTKLADAYKKIEDMAFQDFLTGLWNRRAMYDLLKLEVSRSQREEKQFCLIMCDIDHFKQINDSYGHDAGDFVLKELADVLKKNIRLEDRVSRWGGEEFLFLINSESLLHGSKIAEKIRESVEKSSFIYENTVIPLTMTFGVAVFEKGKTIDEVIKNADRNMYLGKHAGRNRVIT